MALLFENINEEDAPHVASDRKIYEEMCGTRITVYQTLSQ